MSGYVSNSTGSRCIHARKVKNRVLLGANPSLVINAISGHIHPKRYVKKPNWFTAFLNINRGDDLSVSM